jgi:N-glycosylase/DNA lyase
MSVDVLAETLDGGQAFRWNRLVTTDVTGAAAADRKSKTVATASTTGGEPSPIWQGVWSSHVARIRLGADERVEWSAPTAFAASTATALESYFALDRDFGALADTLPWRSDPHLARGIVTFNGLRILRQPFGETLLGFLCSATKQIMQIKQMLALLAERHGAAIRPAPTAPPTSELSTLNPQLSTPLSHQLPTWPELAGIPEADLRACLLGFRARYIAETARFLAAHPGWLEETEALPYAEAK